MFKELDIVLYTIKAAKTYTEEEHLKNAFQEKGLSFDDKLMDYLIKEGYVNRITGERDNKGFYTGPGSHTYTHYQLTAKGEMILAERGFTGKNQEQKDIYRFTKGSYSFAKWALIASVFGIIISIIIAIIQTKIK